MAANVLVEVDNIHRTLSQGGRELRVLRGVSFSIEAGEWIALTGPSGSGKSTLLGIVAGMDRPTRGAVRLEGFTISDFPEGDLARVRNEKIGIVFQSFHLIPTLTAQENVEAPLYIGPRRRQARTLARLMLEQVGLGDRVDHLPHQLSGGEQQRVALARALVGNPSILLADEPTGNLDSATSKQVMGLIRLMRVQMGLSILMVTHDMQIAAYADRRLHLVDGQLEPPSLEGTLHPRAAQATITQSIS